MDKSKPKVIINEILSKIDIVRHPRNLFNEFELPKKKEEIEVEIRKLVIELYQESEKENHYFLDCSLSVYENTYKERLEKFLLKYKDADEVYFLKFELEELTNPTYKENKVSIFGLRNYCNNIIFNTSFDAKKELIRSSLLSFGWKSVLKPELYRIPVTNEGYDKPIEIDFKFEPQLKTKDSSQKLNWIGKPSHLGFIISQLASLEYIETPKRQNGEINYTQLAKLIMNTFNTDVKESSLTKYLNLDSEKGKEVQRHFEKESFEIPHKSTMS